MPTSLATSVCVISRYQRASLNICPVWVYLPERTQFTRDFSSSGIIFLVVVVVCVIFPLSALVNSIPQSKAPVKALFGRVSAIGVVVGGSVNSFSAQQALRQLNPRALAARQRNARQSRPARAEKLPLGTRSGHSKPPPLAPQERTQIIILRARRGGDHGGANGGNEGKGGLPRGGGKGDEWGRGRRNSTKEDAQEHDKTSLLDCLATAGAGEQRGTSGRLLGEELHRLQAEIILQEKSKKNKKTVEISTENNKIFQKSKKHSQKMIF